jgi:integrase
MITTTKSIPLPVVDRIKDLLKTQPREAAWFSLSNNSALRGGDILRIKRSDLTPLGGSRYELKIKERKTNKLRVVPINEEVGRAIERWLAVHPKMTEYLFEGTRGKMGTAYWSQLLKGWCRSVGWTEPRVATHSCRKTFARTKYEKGAKLATIMFALNQSSERSTLIYLGVMADDEAKLYEEAI